MKKTLTLLLAGNPYYPSNVRTAVSIGEVALARGHRVNVFAYADAVDNFVEGQGIAQLRGGLQRLIEIGARVDLCGTCLKFCAVDKEKILPGAHPSSMKNLIEMMKESDVVISLSRH